MHTKIVKLQKQNFRLSGAGCIPIVGFNMGADLKSRVRDLFTRLLVCEVLAGLIAKTYRELRAE